MKNVFFRWGIPNMHAGYSHIYNIFIFYIHLGQIYKSLTTHTHTSQTSTFLYAPPTVFYRILPGVAINGVG